MVNLAAEKGASNWLSVLPVAEHGFYLHKTAVRDAICLRFGWRPDRLPEKCISGSSFTVEHALTCNRGGFSFLRHNEIRDLSAKLLTEVCPNVGIEPELQHLSGETLVLCTANRQDEARVDIRTQGFWGERKQDAFFNVRVFNPHVSSTALLPQAPATRSMRKRSEEYMIREFERLSVAHSPPLFSLPQRAWAQRPKRSMEDWQPSSVRSSSNHTAQRWDGSAVC